MPTISQFFGITVRIYYSDHAPPHFHALYQEHEAKIDIEKLDIISGHLPRRALGLVLDWAELHQQGLRDNWVRAEQRRMLNTIKPLE